MEIKDALVFRGISEPIRELSVRFPSCNFVAAYYFIMETLS